MEVGFDPHMLSMISHVFFASYVSLKVAMAVLCTHET